MYAQKIWDAADGSGTPGRVFTASIPQEAIPNRGTQLDYLRMGVKGAVSTAAVVIETFAGLITPYTLRKGSANRIVLNLDELCALSKYLWPDSLAIGENTDNTGNDFIGDIRIPVYDKADSANQFLHQADRSAVTNIATETVSVTGYWDTGITDKKPIQAVRIPHTTAGSTGIEQLQPRIPAVGTMKALIVKVPNGFADGNIDTSIQRVKVYDDSQVICELNDLGDGLGLGVNGDYVTPAPIFDLLRQFRVFEFGPAGIDCSKGTISLGVDVQDVSDNCVFIPVMEVTVAGA